MAALRDPQPFDTPQTSDAFVVDLPARTGEVHQVTTMPRSIQEILDHADELAKRFEDFDPDNANEIPVEEYLLQRAVVTRARSEQQLIDSVLNARTAGLSWQRIGALLGTSAQAAQQRYGAVLEASRRPIRSAVKRY